MRPDGLVADAFRRGTRRARALLEELVDKAGVDEQSF
jgi:hypothetical protein